MEESEKEIVEVLAGDLDAAPAGGADEWGTVKDGETFVATARSTFKLRVKRLTDYCCSVVTRSSFFEDARRLGLLQQVRLR